MPYIRNLKYTKRALSAVVPAYYTYYKVMDYGEQSWWNKTFGAYQRFVVYNGLHEKIFI